MDPALPAPRVPHGSVAWTPCSSSHHVQHRRPETGEAVEKTFEIEPVGDSCHPTVTHDQLHEGANSQLYGGWPMILSGLNTWLETGGLLTRPDR